MHLNKIVILLAISAFCVNARVLRRQNKIIRVLPKSQPACGCQALEFSGSQPLQEPTYGFLATCGGPSSCRCSGTCGCPGSCGCPGPCSCQNIFLEELPCGCDYECNCVNGYGFQNAEVSSCDRIPVIRLPKTMTNIDAGIPVPAINLPNLYQCDIPSCTCQNTLPYPFLDTPPCSCKRPSYEFLNNFDMPKSIIKMPAESMFPTVFMDAPRSIKQVPNCGCQMPTFEVCGCQRQRCGCQLSALDIPCNCQMPALGSPCGCQYSASDVPCCCSLPAYNSPCGCQLPGLECGFQSQPFNSPCGCQCGCQLQVPNIPYQLPALDVPCSGGCQTPVYGCQSVPLPVIGCGKYLRQVTLQPPFL